MYVEYRYATYLHDTPHILNATITQFVDQLGENKYASGMVHGVSIHENTREYLEDTWRIPGEYLENT